MRRIAKAERCANKILAGQAEALNFLGSSKGGGWRLHDTAWINNGQQRLMLISRPINPEHDPCTIQAVIDSKKAKRKGYKTFEDGACSYTYAFGSRWGNSHIPHYFAAITISLRKPQGKKK